MKVNKILLESTTKQKEGKKGEKSYIQRAPHVISLSCPKGEISSQTLDYRHIIA